MQLLALIFFLANMVGKEKFATDTASGKERCTTSLKLEKR